MIIYAAVKVQHIIGIHKKYSLYNSLFSFFYKKKNCTEYTIWWREIQSKLSVILTFRLTVKCQKEH